MAKKAVNIRLRKDQEAALQKMIKADPKKETDRSKLVRMAVDEFLERLERLKR